MTVLDEECTLLISQLIHISIFTISTLISHYSVLKLYNVSLMWLFYWYYLTAHKQVILTFSTLFSPLILVILVGFVSLSYRWAVIVWKEDVKRWPLKGHTLNHVRLRLKVIQTRGGSKVGDHRGKTTGSTLRKLLFASPH